MTQAAAVEPREGFGADLAGRWNRFWFAPVLPDNLGVCRVLFYGLLLAYFATVRYDGWATIPRSFYDPVWPFEKFHIPILRDPYLGLAAAAWKAALLLACAGFLTRFSTAIAFVLGAYLIGLPYNFGKTDHMTAIVVFTLGFFALSHAGDAFSIDALIRRRFRRIPPPAPSGEYRWPVRAVWLTMAVRGQRGSVAMARRKVWARSESNSSVSSRFGHQRSSRWAKSSPGQRAARAERGDPMSQWNRQCSRTRRWTSIGRPSSPATISAVSRALV